MVTHAEPVVLLVLNAVSLTERRTNRDVGAPALRLDVPREEGLLLRTGSVQRYPTVGASCQISVFRSLAGVRLSCIRRRLRNTPLVRRKRRLVHAQSRVAAAAQCSVFRARVDTLLWWRFAVAIVAVATLRSVKWLA